jgi:hypothetical protein
MIKAAEMEMNMEKNMEKEKEMDMEGEGETPEQVMGKINKEEKVVQVPTWFALLMLCLFVCMLFVVFYLQLVRYKLVEHAIDTKNTAASALLLTPEITSSLLKFM